MRLFVIALAFAALALPAGDPEGLHVWKASELKMIAKALAPKVTETHIATEPIPGLGAYSFIKVFRNATGQAELHETQADMMVIETGEATLVYGGQMVDGKTTAPNEIRAASISGGMEKKLAPGDFVSIPAKTPHQVKLDAGKEVGYFIVKVTQ
jgi:mannose-6-phosphate isomerase-like protein (cupin superfamily)